MRCPAVVLLTDFGWRDPWVAEVKGALLSSWARWPGDEPQPVILDAGHDIPRGDVAAGAWFLGRILPRFPERTVVMAVVDPGVGTSRPWVAGAAGGRWVVGPGNGLLTDVVEGPPVVLDPVRRPVSATFHGRDIFAPAAAALAMGVPLTDLGRVGARADLGAAPYTPAGPAIRWVDHFGNGISDLAEGTPVADRLADGAPLVVDGRTIAGPFATYGAAPADAPFWYWGSGGTVEIAIPMGDAAGALGLHPGLVLDVGKP